MDPTPVIDDSDKRSFLLLKMLNEVIRPAMGQILLWVTPDWDQRQHHFISYLTNVKRADEKKIKKLKKKLNKQQNDAIMDKEFKEWDITLISLLLKYCEGLAEDDHQDWLLNSEKEPECHITALKDIRNTLAHEQTQLSKEYFILKTDEIRKLIENVLKSVGQRCSQVSQGDIETCIKEFTKKLKEIRDATFLPATFDEFQKESLFHELKEHVKKEGMPVLLSHLKRLTTFTPLFLFLVEMKGKEVEVKDIFTDMYMQEDERRVKVLLKDIIAIASNTDPKGFILLKGYAGGGKTTILKKITSDWVQKAGYIKGLDSFDLLLYAEFRDRIESFVELLHHLLGDVHQCFKNKDLERVALDLKILVILDGFDEVNESSFSLFKKILQLAKCGKNLTVIIATRPEAEENLNVQLKSANVNAVHVWLVGIEANKRAEFVEKYFHGLSQKIKPLQGLGGLLTYLKKTGHKMSEVWKLPYNLSLVTILWMLKPEVVNGITTEAELYWQILALCRSKLEERLGRYKGTCALKESERQSKIEKFLEQLSWESLLGLKNDHINLPKLAYDNIAQLCGHLEVPVEELAGAFLKKVTTSKDSHYSFPHKGNQEFMGAYNIYTTVSKSERREKKIIGNIFNKLHDGSPPESYVKYQNLLIQTLSIFHVCENVTVAQPIKKEVLNLLQQSGLSDWDSWLKVMHNLKCDDFTAKWIVERYNIFQRKIVISDSSFDAYCALFKALKPPVENRDKIPVMIVLNETPSSLIELAENIKKLEFQVNQTILLDLFKVPSKITSLQEDAIQILLQNCKRYVGIWSSKFQVPLTMKTLFIRLPNEDAMNKFLASLAMTAELTELRIYISVNVGRVLCPIPEGIQDVSFYISDIQTEEDVEKVPEILCGLRPQVEDRSFPTLSFPRCSLGEKGLPRLVDSLAGFTVKEWIQLPEDIKPEGEVSEEMSAKAQELTQCEHGIMCTSIWISTNSTSKLPLSLLTVVKY
ncbi:uncharacterized protein LOC135195571 isoform X2 [Macrobrachium nipponense]|uniref:uncharacterized protein LOC135195571 isoform X2 n=1 Tax=Macrobrachium nipponense TaxID=159736 RepID=UPI0030C8D34E